jgi:hypothetical protein
MSEFYSIVADVRVRFQNLAVDGTVNVALASYSRWNGERCAWYAMVPAPDRRAIRLQSTVSNRHETCLPHLQEFSMVAVFGDTLSSLMLAKSINGRVERFPVGRTPESSVHVV